MQLAHHSNNDAASTDHGLDALGGETRVVRPVAAAFGGERPEHILGGIAAELERQVCGRADLHSGDRLCLRTVDQHLLDI
ncbi:MAG: hypothetical protein ABIQ39_07915, partial [Ilumatobacteraceae bacterium]